MKKIWALLAILSIAVFSIGMIGCDNNDTTIAEDAIVVNTNPQNIGIWVSAEGEVFATPDLATLNVGIEAEADTVDEARAETANAMEQVMSALDEAGIDDKDIQTAYFNISPIRKWDSDTEEYISTGYRVSNTVTVKVRDMEKIGQTIDSAASAGGDLVRINGINFSVDDPTDYQEEAREKAYEKAKAKAEQLAQLSGAKLGKVTYVTESTGYTYPMPMGAMEFDSRAMNEVATSISVGEEAIRVTVQMAFEID